VRGHRNHPEPGCGERARKHEGATPPDAIGVRGDERRADSVTGETERHDHAQLRRAQAQLGEEQAEGDAGEPDRERADAGRRVDEPDYCSPLQRSISRRCFLVGRPLPR